MKDFIGNFWTFLLALLILPAVYGMARGFINSAAALKTTAAASPAAIYFICGFLTYTAFQIIFSKPIRLYVFGHELTHALSGILAGGKVKSFRAGKNGGSVTLTKAGLFTTLAPYFLPIYTLTLVFIYTAASVVFKEKADTLFAYFIFLCGASIAFHISLTVFAIGQGQADLKKYGILYSLVIVLIFNVLILESIFAIFFKAPVGIFLNETLKNTGSGYITIYNLGVKLKCLTLQTTVTRN